MPREYTCPSCRGTATRERVPSCSRMRLAKLARRLGWRWGYGKPLPRVLLAELLGCTPRTIYNDLRPRPHRVSPAVARRVDGWFTALKADAAWRAWRREHPHADPRQQPSHRRPLPPRPAEWALRRGPGRPGRGRIISGPECVGAVTPDTKVRSAVRCP